MKVLNEGKKDIKKENPCKIKYCQEYVKPPSSKHKFFLFCKKFCFGGYIGKDTTDVKGEEM